MQLELDFNGEKEIVDFEDQDVFMFELTDYLYLIYEVDEDVWYFENIDLKESGEDEYTYIVQDDENEFIETEVWGYVMTQDEFNEYKEIVINESKNTN